MQKVNQIADSWRALGPKHVEDLLSQFAGYGTWKKQFDGLVGKLEGGQKPWTLEPQLFRATLQRSVQNGYEQHLHGQNLRDSAQNGFDAPMCASKIMKARQFFDLLTTGKTEEAKVLAKDGGVGFREWGTTFFTPLGLHLNKTEKKKRIGTATVRSYSLTVKPFFSPEIVAVIDVSP